MSATTQTRGQRLARDAAEAAEVRAYQTDPDVVALRIERVRRQVDWMCWSGIVLGLDKGKPGESYVISGPATTVREAIGVVADVTGKKAPKRAIPVPLMKAMIPIGPLVGKLMGQPPNLRELISSADGVTFWASHEKATRELGYEPRGLEEGLRALLEAEGTLPAAGAAA